MRTANKLGKQTAAGQANEAYKIADNLVPMAAYLNINEIFPTYRKFHLR